MLLKSTSPISLYMFYVFSSKFKITHVACLIFLLDSRHIYLGFGIHCKENLFLCQQLPNDKHNFQGQPLLEEQCAVHWAGLRNLGKSSCAGVEVAPIAAVVIGIDRSYRKPSSSLLLLLTITQVKKQTALPQNWLGPPRSLRRQNREPEPLSLCDVTVARSSFFLGRAEQWPPAAAVPKTNRKKAGGLVTGEVLNDLNSHQFRSAQTLPKRAQRVKRQALHYAVSRALSKVQSTLDCGWPLPHVNPSTFSSPRTNFPSSLRKF